MRKEWITGGIESQMRTNGEEKSDDEEEEDLSKISSCRFFFFFSTTNEDFPRRRLISFLFGLSASLFSPFSSLFSLPVPSVVVRLFEREAFFSLCNSFVVDVSLCDFVIDGVEFVVLVNRWCNGNREDFNNNIGQSS